MPETLRFAEVYFYNTLEAGVTIPVKLFSANIEQDVRAKVDTGSTYCIFERSIGEALGLNIESGIRERIGTATGGFWAYGHTITLEVLNIRTEATVFFIADEGIKRNVLGRTGWLDRVRLGLIDYEGRLFLSANDDE